MWADKKCVTGRVTPQPYQSNRHVTAGFGHTILRSAGHVLSYSLPGNSLLADDELEKLVILRMNRDFMRFMRKHYNHLTKDHFGLTVIDDAE